ncbi:UNKNOWN [Stylonychia lemnae]|uniref:Uncharacterized protein n=1 Tax=Stylonychia lemnae TaxID=5949 RepID=A0A078AD00_STYLE|nr:UNKNOWN [Stylonychia lemnae]|eukprot:CDW80125.1 UNKNOWN [Stylonychia lemnae]
MIRKNLISPSPQQIHNQQPHHQQSRIKNNLFQEEDSNWNMYHVQNPIFQTEVINPHSNPHQQLQNDEFSMQNHHHHHHPNQMPSPFYNQKIFSTYRSNHQSHNNLQQEQLNYREIHPMFFVSREQPHQMQATQNLTENMEGRMQDLMSEEENFINVNQMVKSESTNHLSLADKTMKMRMMYQRNQESINEVGYQGIQPMMSDFSELNNNSNNNQAANGNKNRRQQKQKRKACTEKRGLLTFYLSSLTEKELVKNTLTGFVIDQVLIRGPMTFDQIEKIVEEKFQELRKPNGRKYDQDKIQKCIMSTLTANGLFEQIEKAGKRKRAEQDYQKYWKVKEQEAFEYLRLEEQKFVNLYQLIISIKEQHKIQAESKNQKVQDQ